MAAARNVQKRLEILTGAYRLLSENDYTKVSLSGIAESAGIQKSLLQSYYPQKQRIVGELLEEMLRQSFEYMDDHTDHEGNFFFRASDYTVLFFLTASEDARLYKFVHNTVSCTELMDLWVDKTFDWLWGQVGEKAGSEGVSYLHLKAVLSFAMYGSLKLLRDRNELNLSVQQIFENHIRQLMLLTNRSEKQTEETIAHTRRQAESFNTDAFLTYCEKNIAWFIR